MAQNPEVFDVVATVLYLTIIAVHWLDMVNLWPVRFFSTHGTRRDTDRQRDSPIIVIFHFSVVIPHASEHHDPVPGAVIVVIQVPPRTRPLMLPTPLPLSAFECGSTLRVPAEPGVATRLGRAFD